MTNYPRKFRYAHLAAILLTSLAARFSLAALFCLAALFGLAVNVGQARADAIVVTKAMQASTIAEIFIDPQAVRVELEIAPADLEVFGDLLPDELFATLGKENMPAAERLQRFFRQGLIVRDQHDAALPGAIEQVQMRRRIIRDEVTGEPLPTQPDDAEQVLDVVLRYDFDERPTSLTIQPPLLADSQLSAANIGFVCYHDGLPVNDFRYLPGAITLDLDWRDPWYSRFRHPNLRRQFDAPLSVYLYIEPYEVRKEIIVRPQDLQAWVDLGIGDGDVIPVDRQADLKERVARFLSTKNPVTIDGRIAEGRLDRIHFIHRTLRTTGIVEPPVDLDTTSATLGVIFVYPISKLPDEVSMTWELFPAKIAAVPAATSDEAGGLPSRLTSDDAVLTWKNYLTDPTTPGLLAVARPRSRSELAIPIISVICAGVLVVMLVIMLRQRLTNNALSRRTICATIAIFLSGVVSLPFARVFVNNPLAQPPRVSHEQTSDLVAGLLYNVYRAFDHHDDSLIYDRLSQSIAGDLLPEVYLETRQSMEIKNQGGLRISVKQVTVSDLEAVEQPGGDSEFTYRCRWHVAGWIGHWGHVHRRANEHLANVTIAPQDDRWKITAIEMLDERTIQSPLAAVASGEVGSK